MQDVRPADDCGRSAVVGRSPKRCVQWLDGSIRSAGPALLCVVTMTGVRRIVVTEHTLVRGGPPTSARPERMRRGTRVRVAVVRADRCDLAVVIDVLEAPKPTVDGLAPAAFERGLVPPAAYDGAPRLVDR